MIDRLPDKPCSYETLRRHMRPGDLGLCARPASWISWGDGRTVFSHAFMLDELRNTAVALEFRELIGSRLVTLKSLVDQRPGQVCIFRPPDRRIGAYAATLWLRQMGKPYSYRWLAKNALVHAPILRAIAHQVAKRRHLATLEVTVTPTDTTPTPSDQFDATICSGVGWAYRVAARNLGIDWDPAPFINDRYIQPADLARSGAFDCIFGPIR